MESIDSLVISVKHGFEEMYEFRDEMYGFKNKTETTLFSLDSHARQTNERLDAIEKTLGPLVQVSSFMQKN